MKGLCRAAMEKRVRTLEDSKLGGNLYRGSASLELYRGSLLQSAAQRLHKRLFR
ncbi:hypothetical protein BHM03_00018361 [Ensete ventricosum]|uniref:Uncharacterized protein n=1 Tax=Ensete ventricosum TaxID=4639 RepID=A0A445MFA5_ENSVE|nr:hypothetical protein BHM03_00018361 [Ensete ventricosum]